jgi:hypothetical protein
LSGIEQCGERFGSFISRDGSAHQDEDVEDSFNVPSDLVTLGDEQPTAVLDERTTVLEVPAEKKTDATPLLHASLISIYRTQDLTH